MQRYKTLGATMTSPEINKNRGKFVSPLRSSKTFSGYSKPYS